MKQSDFENQIEDQTEDRTGRQGKERAMGIHGKVNAHESKRTTKDEEHTDQAKRTKEERNEDDILESSRSGVDQRKVHLETRETRTDTGSEDPEVTAMLRSRHKSRGNQLFRSWST